MLRTVGPQGSLFELLLPAEMRVHVESRGFSSDCWHRRIRCTSPVGDRRLLPGRFFGQVFETVGPEETPAA